MSALEFWLLALAGVIALLLWMGSDDFPSHRVPALIRPWRSGPLGRLAGVHSPSAHPYGTCWCQKRARP